MVCGKAVMFTVQAVGKYTLCRNVNDGDDDEQTEQITASNFLPFSVLSGLTIAVLCLLLSESA